MKTIQNWLDEYGKSHQNSLNKNIHWICVPAIMFSLLGLLWSIPHHYFPYLYKDIQLNWAIIVTLAFIFYYFKLSKVMAAGMFLISVFLLLGNYLMQTYLEIALWKISLVIFGVAWVGQFMGHKIEGRKPSFFEDIQFLLIGPAWLLSFIYTKFNIKY